MTDTDMLAEELPDKSWHFIYDFTIYDLKCCSGGRRMIFSLTISHSFFVIYYSLQLKYMVVRQLDMLTDGGCDYTGSLCLCLGNDKFTHDAAVIIIQMADRFIQK